MKDSVIKEKEYKANYEKVYQQATQFYDQKHRVLRREAVDCSALAKNELNKLKAQTQRDLQENLTHFRRQIIQQQQIVQLLVDELINEYSNLRKFEEEYRRFS